MEGAIHIGTSGWSYKHWKNSFYPPKLKTTDWLEFYSTNFLVTEINTSFYRLPQKETVINWTKKVREGFRFCPKMSRFVTHMKKLNDPEESLERYFEVFEPMQKLMGPVLVQLPPFLKFDYNKAEHFYKVLNKNFRLYQFVMEVRHPTWLDDDSLTLMAGHNIGFVVSQSGVGFPYSEMVTANNIYVRFHGPGELYASSYSDKMLDDFAKKFSKWKKEGHVVWGFFNNDINGHAVKDARRLIAMLE